MTCFRWTESFPCYERRRVEKRFRTKKTWFYFPCSLSITHIAMRSSNVNSTKKKPKRHFATFRFHTGGSQWCWEKASAGHGHLLRPLRRDMSQRESDFGIGAKFRYARVCYGKRSMSVWVQWVNTPYPTQLWRKVKFCCIPLHNFLFMPKGRWVLVTREEKKRGVNTVTLIKRTLSELKSYVCVFSPAWWGGERSDESDGRCIVMLRYTRGNAARKTALRLLPASIQSSPCSRGGSCRQRGRLRAVR